MIRESHGITQGELARRMGINQSNISVQFGPNKHALTMRRIAEILEVLGYRPHITIERIIDV